MNIKYIYIGVAAIAIVILVYIFILNTHTNVAVVITDPSNLPTNLQNLTLYYSGVSISMNGAHPHWFNSSYGGKIDMATLINKTEVLTEFPVSSAADVREVIIWVSGVETNILGMNVTTLFEKDISVNVSGGAGNAILISLSPSLIPIFTQNSTDFYFEPSAVAALTNYALNTTSKIQRLSNEQSLALESLTPKLYIVNGSFGVANGQQSISITVRDVSSYPATLKYVFLSGAPFSAGNNLGQGPGNGSGGGGGSRLGPNNLGVISFVVSENGTMYMINSSSNLISGYVLSAERNITLKFNGEFAFRGGKIVLTPLSPDVYSFVVQGDNGARAASSLKYS